MLWYVTARVLISSLSSINPTISALESYRSDTLSSLFPVFYSSSQWSQWRPRPGAVPDSRTLPSLPLFSPSSIYPLTWQPARQHCAIALHSRRSHPILFSSLHLGMCLCLLFPLLLLSFPSIFFSLPFCCSLIPLCPRRKQQLVWGL